eukprot:CAMPEP_0197631082 /NCGR_PEP_ID=MMETSP1338-20131121/8372_1 /TAXON_ID=43686 ORGANISM="Pelagodinium beii, Strain RCC1491" /NCGR_SAMPLE_ID=MMETSP1338 /ASSEMBLY_ACC=CAM_ASM_000754 /LENGTH=133 /DNA_ID=CAMNT_0043202471 /DNA_START=96 /DNA_END=498 /DNA_ORIENTATION=+
MASQESIFADTKLVRGMTKSRIPGYAINEDMADISTSEMSHSEMMSALGSNGACFVVHEEDAGVPQEVKCGRNMTQRWMYRVYEEDAKVPQRSMGLCPGHHASPDLEVPQRSSALSPRDVVELKVALEGVDAE